MTGRWSLFCIISMVSIVSGASGQVATMAYWDFGPDSDYYTEQVLIDGIAGIPTLAINYGDKDINGKTGLEYTDQGGTYHADGRAGAWDNVNSSSDIVITVNTTGWSGLTLRWDYNSEYEGGGVDDDRGPPSFDMDYRVGETGNWEELLDNEPLTRDTLWHGFTKSLAFPAFPDAAIIEDEPFVQFRIYDFSRLDESGGVFKVDNFELTGTPVFSTITVLTPNGGENLMAGDVSSVTWTWTTGDVLDFVTLDYSVNYGVDWIEIGTVANTGVYAWKVPGVDSLNCLIRVSNAANPQVNDTGNAAFRIFQCLLNYDLSGDCYIDLQDLAMMASEWLQCGDVLDPRCL
jgi:hypothetical protein